MAAGFSADMDFESRSVKAQFRQADRFKVKWAVILGPDEVAQGKVKLKSMSADGPAESTETMDGVIGRLRAGAKGAE